MTDRLLLALCLGAVWGAVWAVFLQRHTWGRWLAVRRTWLTVVVGVGVDLLLLLLVLDWHQWAQAAAIVAVSSIGVIVRSLLNEHREDVA
jgi:Kef-type K+ transport system membrane component KefB